MPGVLKQHRRKQSSGQFYFVTHKPGHSESVRDAGDDLAVVETKGSGASDEEYQARPVNRNLVKGMSMKESERSSGSRSKSSATQKLNALSRTLFAIFGTRKIKSESTFNEGAKKVDPKVFFANERTFLKWMNVSVWVAGISIGLSTIVDNSPIYNGLVSVSSLAVSAIAIIIVSYSTYQYARRSLMIVKRSPGPYEDRWGPVVIGSLFVITFTAQYCIFIASSYGEQR